MLIRIRGWRRADIEATDTVGNTPLMFAAASGFSELLEELLSRRAVVGARSDLGRTLRRRFGLGLLLASSAALLGLWS